VCSDTCTLAPDAKTPQEGASYGGRVDDTFYIANEVYIFIYCR